MHKHKETLKTFFHVLLLALFTGAAAILVQPSFAGERPLVQYDDTDIAPPMPDVPDAPDPLFEDSDPDTGVPDPFADDLNPESPDPDGITPEDSIGDDTEPVSPPITD